MKNLGEIRKILYRLKKEYGIQVVLRNPVSRILNRETGEVTDIEYLTKTLRRAIVLPAKVGLGFTYDLSYLMANRNFTYGGFYGASTRIVIVDGKDLNGFEIREETEVIFESATYSLKDFNPIVGNRSFLLTVTSIRSQG